MPRESTARRPDFDPLDSFEPVASAARERSGPERRLLLAVLSDAIVMLTRHRSGRRRANPRDVAATAHWVRSDDVGWPCSFINICEALGLAHQPLRRALLGPSIVGQRFITRRRLRAGKRI